MLDYPYDPHAFKLPSYDEVCRRPELWPIIEKAWARMAEEIDRLDGEYWANFETGIWDAAEDE